MYYKIMNAKHTLILISHNDLIDLLHKFRFRWLTEQGPYGFLCGTESCQENKNCHNHTAVAVDLQTGKLGKKCGAKHCKGCNGIA